MGEACKSQRERGKSDSIDALAVARAVITEGADNLPVAQLLSSDAKLARLAGVASIPASSGRTQRHRPDRRGNRQLNRAFHRIAVTKAALIPTPVPTSHASKPRGRAGWTPSAVSNATSSAASGNSSTTPNPRS
jgi:hypothetical protein